LRALVRALGLVRAHRELWLWWALPSLMNLVAFGLAVWVFVANLDTLTSLVQGWLEVGDPTAWYEWVWIGPVRGLAWLVRWILLIVFAMAVYLLFTLLGGVIASPVLDVLSERVERLVDPSLPAEESGLGAVVRTSLRALVEEGRRTLFFVVVQLGLLGVGLVPGLQGVAVVASVVFTVLFLPLDYTGYVLDRRRIPFRVRRAWILRHRTAMASFGLVAMGTFLVPGLNFLCLPWLVTAGTCLAVGLGLPSMPAETGASAPAQTEQTGNSI